MTHLSLFSGIGGLDLAAEMAGFKTVGQVEIDDYCNRVLEHHWPDVPRWRDVKDVTAESFERRTGIKPGALAVLSGGFPCQPVSCAGKRKGDTDERWLWDEMLRVICEIRPRWVVAENVRGLLSAQAISDGRKLFGRILRDLAQSGYRVGWLCYGAGDVGAPHRRERVFIVAHSEQSRTGDNDQEACNEARGACETGRKGVRQGNRQACTGGAGTTGQDVAYTPQHLFNRPRQTRETGRGEFADGGMGNPGSCGRSGEPRREAGPEPADGYSQTKEVWSRGQGTAFAGIGNSLDGLPAGLAGHRWPAGPGPQHPWEPPRIAARVKDGVAKLKALGNAVVPAQAYPIFRAIMEIERAAL
jgi:DNA (cytosine-5)-methyltransferase 1